MLQKDIINVSIFQHAIFRELKIFAKLAQISPKFAELGSSGAEISFNLQKSEMK